MLHLCIFQTALINTFFPWYYFRTLESAGKDIVSLGGYGEAGDVMHLSQNVVETFIDRIEVFNDERVKIHFTFEDTLKSYETG